ncbi:MAG: OB-fold nucleic acid binding domain-containing protein [Thermoplasmata archaeon]
MKEMAVQNDQEAENKCNSCGRYIGPIYVCPFCGSKVKRSRRVSYTRNLALILAVVGLLVFHAWSIGYGNPDVNLEDLNETSNYAYVTLNGVVTRAPVYYPGEDGGPGTIYFTVDDGTGDISVRAYPIPVVRDMLETGKIPGFGDRVKVTGNTYWYNAERGFILNSLSQLEIYREEPMPMTIAEVNDLDRSASEGYYRVNVTGTVSSWRQYYSAVDVTLIDGSGNEMSLYVPNSVMELTGTGPLGRLEIGMALEAVGCLEYYDAGSYSKWEIIPASMLDIREV